MPLAEPLEMSGNKPPDLKGYPRDGSFAELLRWHFHNGTRPDGDPSRIGRRRWTPKDFAVEVGSEAEEGRAIRYWISLNKPKRPNDLASIERAIFGDANKNYDDWRRDLRAAYDRIAAEEPDLGPVTAPEPAPGAMGTSPSSGGQIDHQPGLGQKLVDLISPPHAGRFPPRPPLHMVGRAGALAELKSRLGVTGGHPASDRTIVRGVPGIGKTTLVNALAYEPEVIQYFSDGVLWTSLAQRPGILAELAAWGRALGVSGLERYPSIREAVQELARRLRDTRMLLIIDDVWDPAHALPFIGATGLKCGLLLTTRLPMVADALSSTSESTYLLPLLDETDGLALMRLLAPSVVEVNVAACRELVRRLGYLPLALHVAGRLLNVEARMGWSVDDLLIRLRDGTDIIKSNAPADRQDIESPTTLTVEALLNLSTNLLQGKSRDFFAFLGAFAPAPATFDLDALKAVWQVEDPKPIIRELASLGLIEPVGGRFEMHELLVAHARSFLDT
jgi:hypothetical protein